MPRQSFIYRSTVTLLSCLALTVAAAGCGGGGAAGPGAVGAESAGGLVGSPAPEINAEAVTGEGPSTLKDANGRVVVLDFWATFCEPCKKSFPKYQELMDQFGGDLVVIPKGSKRVDDALAFMHYLLNDTQQVELYAKALNLPTRTDPKLTDNQYYKAEPLMGDVAKALAVGRTPYSLTFFEQINDPAGPWLQQLQKAYYTADDLDKVIGDGKTAMKAISCKS